MLRYIEIREWSRAIHNIGAPQSVSQRDSINMNFLATVRRSLNIIAIPAQTSTSYSALAALILGESVGIPVPGATALIAAGILASHGKLNIFVVCLIGVLMTVVGANLSYLIGRRYGVKLLTFRGPLKDRRKHLLGVGEPLVMRYGWFAVLIARSVPVLREITSLLVGALRMTWHRFLFWNTLGGVIWVLSYTLIGYYVGRLVGIAHGLEIILAAKIVAAVIFGMWIVFRRRQKSGGPVLDEDVPRSAGS